MFVDDTSPPQICCWMGVSMEEDDLTNARRSARVCVENPRSMRALLCSYCCPLSPYCSYLRYYQIFERHKKQGDQ
jgi:hypothetical protein